MENGQNFFFVRQMYTRNISIQEKWNDKLWLCTTNISDFSIATDKMWIMNKCSNIVESNELHEIWYVNVFGSTFFSVYFKFDCSWLVALELRIGKSPKCGILDGSPILKSIQNFRQPREMIREFCVAFKNKNSQKQIGLFEIKWAHFNYFESFRQKYFPPFFISSWWALFESFSYLFHFIGSKLSLIFIMQQWTVNTHISKVIIKAK